MQACAEKLNHPAQDVLERPFVTYVDNQPGKAREHFYGLREAKRDLIGFALFDQIDQELRDRPELREYMWKKREIENYLCQKVVLMAWAGDMGEQKEGGALFASVWKDKMEETIAEIEQALKTLGKGSPWDSNTKVSDDFLDPLFKSFFQKFSMPNLMQKTNYHTLTRYVPKDQIDPEISTVLDAILEVAEEAESPNEETT